MYRVKEAEKYYEVLTPYNFYGLTEDHDGDCRHYS